MSSKGQPESRTRSASDLLPQHPPRPCGHGGKKIWKAGLSISFLFLFLRGQRSEGVLDQEESGGKPRTRECEVTGSALSLEGGSTWTFSRGSWGEGHVQGHGSWPFRSQGWCVAGVCVSVSVNICGHLECFPLFLLRICGVGLWCVLRRWICAVPMKGWERPWDVLILRLCSDCEMARFFFLFFWLVPFVEVCLAGAPALALE